MGDLSSKIYSGHYSHISLIAAEKGKLIEKMITIPLRRAEAEEMRQMILLQRSALETKGVPISELVEIDILPIRKDYNLKITEVFAGLDFMDVVSNDNYAMYLEKLLHNVYKPLLVGTDPKLEYIPVGIDPVMRNFVYDNKTGKFRYVDFFPPKLFYKGKYLQEVPEIVDKDFFNVRMLIHNSAAGIMYATYVNLVREFPAKQKITMAIIETFLQQQNRLDLGKLIFESPLYRQTEVKRVKEIMQGIKDWYGTNFLLIREIANWFTSRNIELDKIKKEIYSLTYQETDPASAEFGRISTKNFTNVKILLAEGLNKCQQ